MLVSGQAEHAHSTLERVARTTINIVCLRYCPPSHDEPALKRLNVEIMLRLQEDASLPFRTRPSTVSTVCGSRSTTIARGALISTSLCGRFSASGGNRDARWGWRIATGRICFGLVGIWAGSLPMVAMYPVLGSFCRRLLRGSQGVERLGEAPDLATIELGEVGMESQHRRMLGGAKRGSVCAFSCSSAVRWAFRVWV